MEHYTALKITYCVQAKLWNGNHRPEHVKPDLVQTLTDLQLDYIDSFVIHWPQVSQLGDSIMVWTNEGTVLSIMM